jgi:ATP-dependent Clp protease protease subunit
MFSYSPDEGIMTLNGVIGEDWYGGGITSSMVQAASDEMRGKQIQVRINSVGGVADEGVAIYNILRRHPGGVHTVVESLAASAASIIALAGNKRTTLRGGRWMIHKALTLAVGNEDDMLKVAEMLRTYDKSLVDIYSGSMKEKDPKAIMKMMKDETWFTGSEAVAAGLSTDYDEDEESEEMPMNAAWFTRAPQDLFTAPKAALKPKPASIELARMRLRLQMQSIR